MKRRDFILAGTAGIAAILIPTAYYYFKDIEYDLLLAQPKSLSLIWDAKEIDEIGNKYRMLVPQEKKANTLVKRLLEETDTNSADIGETLAGKIQKDFETGNTVIVDGWILSVTEARQCALFSTIEPK